MEQTNQANQTADASNRLDQALKSLEKNVAYYIANPDQLYRPYVALSLVSHSFSLILMLVSNAQTFTALTYFSFKVMMWIGLGLVYHFGMIVLSLALKTRLQKKTETAKTLFASHLVLQLVGLCVVSCAFGLLAFVNTKFREETN